MTIDEHSNPVAESSQLSKPFDAILPAEMARRAEQVGAVKASMPLDTLFILAVLAGAFIALGAVFSTTVTATTGDTLPFGATKMLGGIAFSLGLILVVVAGAELFTGNNLIVMALASGKITVAQVIRNWAIVYAGNFVGAVATAVIMLLTGQFMQGHGAIGENMLNIAHTKCQYSFVQAFALGIVCNALVCLAVWLCYSARTTAEKIASIIFPITAFVAAGFEHSVANMYFIPMGLFLKSAAPDALWQAIGTSAESYSSLTWSNFFVANLLPVTLGNIFGGSVMVGLVYWFVYLRKRA